MKSEFRNVSLTAADLAIAHSPWPALNRLNGLAVLTLVAAPVLVGIALAMSKQGSAAVAVGGLVAGGCLLVWALVCRVAGRVAARLYASTPLGVTPLDWCFDDRGLIQSSLAIRSELPWSSFVEVREDSHRFLFLLTPYSMIVLPKRYGSEGDMKALRELIHTARREGQIKSLPFA